MVNNKKEEKNKKEEDVRRETARQLDPIRGNTQTVTNCIWKLCDRVQHSAKELLICCFRVAAGYITTNGTLTQLLHKHRMIAADRTNLICNRSTNVCVAQVKNILINFHSRKGITH